VDNRRDFFGRASLVLGGLMSLVVAVPGVAYLLDPILRKSKAETTSSENDFKPLASLAELEVGVPKAFQVIDAHTDAWVRYPEAPIGTVWLIRNPEGAKEPVTAFSADCPHLGCGVMLSADRKNFACPCHTSAFAFDGHPLNSVPPRGMDRLPVKLSADSSPKVLVHWQRFRSQTEEQIPIG
jgi:Rieske Fe-S protein